MASTTSPLKTDAHMLAVFDALAEAAQAHDVDAIMATCTSEAAVLEALPLPVLPGQGQEPAVSSFVGEADYEVRELLVDEAGEVAITRAFCRFGGVRPDGSPVENWLRTVDGFRKVDGRWQRVQQEVCLPLDAEDDGDDYEDEGGPGGRVSH